MHLKQKFCMEPGCFMVQGNSWFGLQHASTSRICGFKFSMCFGNRGNHIPRFLPSVFVLGGRTEAPTWQALMQLRVQPWSHQLQKVSLSCPVHHYGSSARGVHGSKGEGVMGPLLEQSLGGACITLPQSPLSLLCLYLI